MSTSNYPSSTTYQNSSPKKDYKNIIYALLIGALVCTWGYIIYDKSKVKEEKIMYVDRITKDSLSQTLLQSQFELLSGKADSITVNNQELQGSLAEKNNNIQKQKKDIAAILSKKNATTAELLEAKKQMAELQTKVELLYAEVETLKAENKQLTVSNEQLNTDKKQLTDEKGSLQTNLDKTVEEKAKVEDVASTLHASNINISAVNVRGSKEKETSNPSRHKRNSLK